MLIAVIPIEDYQNTKKQIDCAEQQANCIELRVDYMRLIDFNMIARLRYVSRLPIMFTLRKKSQGGFYSGDEDSRLKYILELCRLSPDYIDLEYDTSSIFLEKIKLNYPHIKLICSYHNFHETPANLLSIFQSMKNPLFDLYKIVTYANKASDALRMLHFVKTLNKKYTLTGICMGKEGECTRILSPIVGNAMHYAIVDTSKITAPGQLTLHELLTIYHFKKLNSNSKVYALLGDPISESVGHILHNQAIEILEENAIYIKIRVTKNDLSEVINYCRQLSFFGFSITMPLKEAILPLLDEVDDFSKSIKAINSIIFHEEKYIGFNTDGIGAFQVLSGKTNIKKQKIVILGAGGAARAIAYEACKNQSHVTILNRTFERAKILAEELQCKSGNLYDLSSLKYHIIINTLPDNIYSEKTWLCHKILLPYTFAMDIVYKPSMTAFLQIAKKAKCISIPGYEMYTYQALNQINRWFQPNSKQLNAIKDKMQSYFRCIHT